MERVLPVCCFETKLIYVLRLASVLNETTVVLAFFV